MSAGNTNAVCGICANVAQISHMDRCKAKLDRHLRTCVYERLCVRVCVPANSVGIYEEDAKSSMQPSACSITRFTVNCDNGGGDMQIKVSCKVRASQIDVM